MANIVNIHDFIRLIERKERGAFHTIEEIDLLLDRCQMEVYEGLIDEYAVTQKIHDALSVFKASYPFTTNSSGVLSLPANYLHLRNGYTILGSTLYKITFPEDDEFTEAVNSQLRPISVFYPLGRHEGSSITLFPNTIHYGVINYFRRPATPVYAYTLNGRQVVYDSNASVQLEWQDTTYLNKIIVRVLGYLGINLEEQDITAFGLQDEKNIP